MLRHTLTQALKELRTRIASGDPDLTAARHLVERQVRMSPEAHAYLDKLLAETRAEASREELLRPFPEEVPAAQSVEHRVWVEACESARRNMAPPLSLTVWRDEGGLTRLEMLGLLTLALRRLAATPEFGAGPLLPGLQR
ncbi:hypothetical protein MFUL124B02_23940 [Myxococcus fulvus 124B02]|nr:hypothetical protein MFUL124B02_23940 [Myxococcus fulvus 124B02]